MNKNLICIPVETKQRSILLIRVQKVILDHDLAELYGVETKYMNRQVRLEKKIGTHDVAIQDIVATIRQIMASPPPPKVPLKPKGPKGFNLILRGQAITECLSPLR